MKDNNLFKMHKDRNSIIMKMEKKLFNQKNKLIKNKHILNNLRICRAI